MLPTSSHSARISGVEVELGFVGDGKVFVKVEKQKDNSEKLMIYEAKNTFTGFFLNLFRDRKTTFTAREWAAKSQKKNARGNRQREADSEHQKSCFSFLCGECTTNAQQAGRREEIGCRSE